MQTENGIAPKIINFLLILVFLVPMIVFSAEKAPEPLTPEQKAQKAFTDSLNHLIPLTSKQVEDIQKKKTTQEKILQGKPPRIKNRTITIKPQPGLQPSKLTSLAGYGTGVIFLDKTGSSWPIDKVIPGSDTAINLVKADENYFTFNTLQNLNHTNISVKLKGLSIPLMFHVLTDSNAVKKLIIDGVVTVRINRPGPNAIPPIVEQEPEDPANEKMLSYLDGIPPDDSKKIKDLPDLQVYQEGDKLFLRTIHPLIWPAWNAVVRGSMNTRVYELNSVTSLMVNINGKIERINFD